jgi:hypothetical protein
VEKRLPDRAERRHDVPVTSLGDTSPSVVPPAAARATRPGWRDPRLWVGVAIVAVSVVAGARLLGAADESVTVWAAADDLAAGADVTADDLEPRQVRFVDPSDLDRYYRADQVLPTDARLVRGVGDGELLPRAAVGTPDAGGVLQLPVAVDLVPASVDAGSVVSVYVRDTTRCSDCAGAALESVTVVDAPAADELTGVRQLVLAVEQGEADRWFELLATLETPVVTVVGS